MNPELLKTDVQAWNEYRVQHPDWVPDLSGANLRAADLTRAHLREADLRGADLYRADLRGAVLTEADLSLANLIRANLTEADLTEADLTEANLTEANLTEADLSLADLTEADLTEADLTEADLTEADLSLAVLTGAKNIIQVGPIGSEGRIVYAVQHVTEIYVQAGCWWGTLDELESRVDDVHQDSLEGDSYRAFIQMMRVYQSPLFENPYVKTTKLEGVLYE